MMRSSSVAVLVVVLAAALLWWLVEAAPATPPSDAAPRAESATAAPAIGAEAPAEAKPGETARTPVNVEAVPNEPRPTLRGRLVRQRQPLANVVVLLLTGSPQTTEVARATTGADGTFVLPAPEKPVRLAAESPSVPAGWWFSWIQPATIDRDLGDMHVPAGGTIDGVVLGDAGRPVRGARLFHQRGECADWRPGAEPMLTDDAGRFHLENVHPGSQQLRVLADGYAAKQASVDVGEGAVASTTVQLDRGGWIAGRVFDWQGKPLTGAVVSSDGVETRTDEHGDFTLRRYGGQSACFAAAGHHARWENQSALAGRVEIRLERAITLRGVVHGHRGALTTVLLEDAGDTSALWSCLVFGDPRAVAKDGTFVVGNLGVCDCRITARAEGVGVSQPVALSLREDAAVELTIEPGPTLELRLRDDRGAPVAHAELIVDAGILKYPSLYAVGPKLDTTIANSSRCRSVPLVEGDARLSAPADQPLAFLIRAPGFLPETRVFAAGAVPATLEVVLRRAGRVHGIVRGGSSAAYLRSVVIWREEDDAAVRAPKRTQEVEQQRRKCEVDAAGAFGADELEPGRYFAAVSRYGMARSYKRSWEQVDAVPVVDENEDFRTVVAFEAVPGEVTRVELSEPPLGRLRGRVSLAGKPVAGARVIATREGWQPHRRFARDGQVDWDDDFTLDYASGQRTAADGTFEFLYRDAGLVEVRARHPNAAATSAPLVVTLPAPGVDATCEVSLTAGCIRGRFDFTGVDERDRKRVNAVLFPMDKAAQDPFVSWDWHAALTWSCSHQKLPEDGSFAFDLLPAGDWLLRICAPAGEFAMYRSGERIAWQRVVAVGDTPVELGTLAAPRRVKATFAWAWSGPTSLQTANYGVQVLRAHGGNPRAVWTALLRGGDPMTLEIEPGEYTLVLSGWPSSTQAVSVRVAADGTVTPSVANFDPPRENR